MMRLRRAQILAGAVVVLVAVTAASVVLVAVNPEPAGYRRALFCWVLVLVLMVGVPIGADLADWLTRRGRLRINVRHVSGPREDQP
ncbi:hypothetical protein C2142_29095 [Streptomyces sp. CB01881]|nr:hypothetical protein C2142_29095 [Streptomyces sp. CB01881]